MKKTQKERKMYNATYHTGEYQLGKRASALLPFCSSIVRRFTLAVTLLAGVFASGSLLASHIVGGELNYRCLGNNQYEVNLVIYRDCENALPGATFDNPASVGIFDGLGNRIPFIGVGGQILMRPRLIDKIDPGLNPGCAQFGPDVCVEYAIYRDTITLPIRQGGYILSHQRCCRNVTLSNVVDPVNTGSTYTAEISDVAVVNCNQGAQFKEWPPVYICLGDNINFDHSAIDPDGDSLVYKLCTPYLGATRNQPKPQPPAPPKRPPSGGNPSYDTIVWQPGFSTSNMLGSQAGQELTIDPRTGLITGIPSAIGQFLVGICVEEYRNGELISTHRRDFQYNVVSCGDIPRAAFDAPSIQCGDLTVNFVNNSTNANFYRWYFDWPSNLSFTTDDQNPAPQVYPDTGVYRVALIAYQDSVCTDTLIKTLILRNTGLEADFDYEAYNCGDSILHVFTDQSSDTVSTLAEWDWTIIYGNNNSDTINLSGSNVSTYLPAGVPVKVILTVTAANGCSKTIEKNFTSESDQGLVPDFTYYIEKCEDVYTLFVTDATTDNSPGGATILSWDYTLEYDATTETSDLQNPTFVINGFKRVKLSLEVESSTGCIGTVTKEFDLNPDLVLDAAFSLQALECVDTLIIQFLDQTQGDPISWDWTIEHKDGVFTSTDQNPIFGFDTTQTLIITLKIEQQNGCISETTDTIRVNLLVDNIIIKDYEVCPGKRVQLNPTAVPGLVYEWSPLTGLFPPVAINPSPWAGPDETTVYSVTITDPAINCSVEKQVTVVVKDAERADFTAGTECGSLEVDFVKTTGGPVVRWEFGDAGGSTSTEETVTFTYAAAGTYDVTLYTGGECPDTITKSIKLIDLDLGSLRDTIVACEGDSVELNPNGNPNFIYEWSPEDLVSDPNSHNPKTKVTQNTTFTVRISDPAQDTCHAIRTVTVVLPDPIDINTDSNLEFCKDTTITFVASSGSAVTYTWKDGAGNVLGTGPELTITLTTDITIIVEVLDEYGCTTRRAVNVDFFKVTFTTDGNIPLCFGDTTTIYVTAPYPDSIVGYSWIPVDQIISGANTNAIVVSPDVTTNYTVSVTYKDGCVVTGTYTLLVSGFEPLVCSIEPDTILVGGTATLSVTSVPGYTYRWEPADLLENPDQPTTSTKVLTDPQNTEFTVTITNPDGCEITCTPGTLTVAQLACDEPYIFLPNSFTPNGDGVNDVLKVRVFEPYVRTVELIIYNRWGQEIFKTTDLNTGWDGTFKSEEMPIGSYGYHLRVFCIDEQEYVKKGNVSIIR